MPKKYNPISVFNDDKKEEVPTKETSLIKSNPDAIIVKNGYYDGSKPMPLVKTKEDITPEQQKKKDKTIIVLTSVFLVVLLIVFANPISSFISSVKKEPTKSSNLMPDVIGLTLDDASSVLENYHLSSEYVYDNFHDYNTIVKTSVDAGAKLNPSQNIILYVSSNQFDEFDISDSIIIENLDIEKSGLKFSAFVKKDDKIFFNIENASSQSINNILLTFSQKTVTNQNLPNRTYIFNDLNLEPGFKKEIFISSLNKTAHFIDIDHIQIID